MAIFERDGITLYYEDHGAGFPVLLFAPLFRRQSRDLCRQPGCANVRQILFDFVQCGLSLVKTVQLGLRLRDLQFPVAKLQHLLKNTLRPIIKAGC